MGKEEEERVNLRSVQEGQFPIKEGATSRVRATDKESQDEA